MADSPSAPEGFSLKRWSRRKLAAAQAASVPPGPAAITPGAVDAVALSPAVAAPAPPVVDEAPALPPVESLTHDSDFSAFMQPKVDEAIKRAALKKLFTDPRFNVMDGLDIYVGDYTQPDPMPDGMLEKLGKVYAAVIHDEDAGTPTPAVVPEPVSAESAPLQEVPAGTVQDDTAADEADAAGAVAADAPAPAAALTVPSMPHDPTASNPPLAHPRGKPL